MIDKLTCENCGEECDNLGYRYQVCPNCGNFLYLEKEDEWDSGMSYDE